MAAVPITVPQVGESISEGILSRWLIADGASVKAGDPVVELETDKATTEVPAPASGVVKHGAAEGDTVDIGAAIGSIDPDGKPAAEKAPAPEKAPEAQKPAAEAPKAPEPEKSGAGCLPAASDPTLARPSPSGPKPATTFDQLAPSVHRIVAEEGLDPSQITGTGRGGRITKGDALGHLESRGAAEKTQAPAPAPAKPQATGDRETRQRMTGLRKRIAQRLVEAQQTAAILTTFNEADMTRIMELRAKYKEKYQKAHGVSLGFMSFFIKAAIEALKEFPAVNGRIEGDEIVLPNYYNVGVAVSTERGLMVPVIRDADALSFAEIEKAIVHFADKARKGAITVDDLQGGTFTITNGGIFGSLLSTPILNPPQSGILGMHAIKKRPMVVDDQIVIRPMMYLALSYDHRLIDGREAVSALVRIKDCLEDPERMMLSI